MRFVLAAAIFGGLILLGQGSFSVPRPLDLARYGWLSFLLVVYFVTMFEALRLTDALSTSAVFTLAPPMTALMSWVALRQRLTVQQCCALLIAGAAAVWVLFDGDLERLRGFSPGRGETIFLFGCVAYAAYTPSVRRLIGDRGLIELTFWTLAAGVLLLGAHGWRAIGATDWSAISIGVYLGALHLAVFTTALSFYLIQYASVRLPGAKVMAYTYLIPAFVMLQETALGEPWPAWPVLAGVLVIAMAMVMLQRAGAGSSAR
jgi:drug/metabolite transporter (DMT)-like permease